jgi:hypothetical protein
VKENKRWVCINLGPWLGNSEHVSGLAAVAVAAAATIFFFTLCQFLFPHNFEL